QPRVGRQHGVGADAVAVGEAGPQVLHHHVGAADQGGETAALPLVLVVDGDRALAGVERGEDGAEARRPLRRDPGAGVVAALGTLDLHHLGAERRQHPAGIGHGDAATELDDADPLERRRAGGGSLPGHSATTSLTSVPTPPMAISMTSPTFIHTGGSRREPTPPGVPVAITSPGTSSVKVEA